MRKKLDLKSFARISRDFHALRKTEKKSDVENQNRRANIRDTSKKIKISH